MPKKAFEIHIKSYEDFIQTTRALDDLRGAVLEDRNEKGGLHLHKRYKRNPLPITSPQVSMLFGIAAGLLRNIRHAYSRETDITQARVRLSWNSNKGRGSVSVRQSLPPDAQPVDLDEIRKTRPGKLFDKEHSGTGLIDEIEHPKGLRRRALESVGLIPSPVSIKDVDQKRERVARIRFREDPTTKK